MRVLVVEDEPLIRMLAADILEAAGLAVTQAGSVAAALVAAGEESFDAALLDLGLPDASTAALIRALLLLQPGLGLVVSTGRQQDDPRVAAVRDAGGACIAAILSKPWVEDAVLEALRSATALTRRNRGASPQRPGAGPGLRAS